MKQIIILATVSSLIFSCSSTVNESEKESMAVINKYMEAVEANNYATMDLLLSDDYKGYGPSVGDSVNKKQALENWQYNAAYLYESIKFSKYLNVALKMPEGELAAGGNWVSDWALVTIKYKDGRGPVQVAVNAIYRVNDGKIVHSRTFYNEADVLRQLGYEFSKKTE